MLLLITPTPVQQEAIKPIQKQPLLLLISICLRLDGFIKSIQKQPLLLLIYINQQMNLGIQKNSKTTFVTVNRKQNCHDL